MTVRLDVKSRKTLQVPPSAGNLRLKLHRRGHKLGTLELPPLPHTSWPAILHYAIDHEALVQQIPKYVGRYAWRDRRFAGRLLRIGTDERTRRFLWDLAHLRPARWRTRLFAYLGNRATAILGCERSAAVTSVSGTDGRHAPSERPKVSESARWEAVFAAVDPWDYGNTYEQTK